jgi:hypothetical protein
MASIDALLQTPGYAAAAHHATQPGLTAGQVTRLAAITLHRQDILHRDGFRCTPSSTYADPGVRWCEQRGR